MAFRSEWASVVALLFVSLALAGCASAPAPTPVAKTSDVEPVAPEAFASDSMGAIQGFVTDDSLQPIPGVLVSLIEASKTDPVDELMNATSAMDGGFSFSLVPPGTYRVGAKSPDNRSGYRLVEVDVAQVSKAHVILDDLGGNAPRSNVVVGRGSACIMRIRATVTTCGTTLVGGTPNKIVFEYPVTPELRSAVAGVTWKRASYASSAEMHFALTQYNLTGGYVRNATEAPSPIFLRNDVDGAKENSTVELRANVPQEPLVAYVSEQSFDFAIGFFYHELAPDEYSPLPDS